MENKPAYLIRGGHLLRSFLKRIRSIEEPNTVLKKQLLKRSKLSLCCYTQEFVKTLSQQNMHSSRDVSEACV